MGNHYGPQNRFEHGLGSGIHQDFTYLPVDRQSVGAEQWQRLFSSWFEWPGGVTVSFTEEWPEMVDRIYRGTLLYHFYLERELTNLQRVPGGVHLEFDKGKVVVETRTID